ncbi:MAG: CPBP family intramembrane metalloprotease [Bacteroidales bacterium]|nr:CPBP family intramembrane metalloprotease [Bacteroidales bacterium]
MKSTGIFSYFSPGIKFFWFAGISIIFLILSAFGSVIAGKLMGLDMGQIMQISGNPMPGDDLSFLYVAQFINQIGLFIIAPLLYVFLFEKPTIGVHLKLNRLPNIFIFILSAITVYTLLPFINLLTEWNAQLSLPEALSGIQKWMIAKEAQADQITNLLLRVSTTKALLLNLFVIALMPALGEELMFRGVLQQLFLSWTRNKHVAVFLTAFIFSAIHMQFFGFLPRFVLGLLLGYLFVYTNSLWVPMLVHFVNNASSVIIFYLNYNGDIKVNVDTFGSWPNFFGISISLILTILIVYFVKRQSEHVPESV